MTLTAAERNAFLDRYEAGPALLRAAWAEVPAEASQWRPEEGKREAPFPRAEASGRDAPRPVRWSAHEVVVHCADSEAYAHTRIRLLLAEPEPLIVGYDENRWAQVFDYHAHDVDLAFATIDAVRANTLACLRRLPESAWGRTGRHTQSGVYTDADWLRSYGEHLEVHAAQIRRNLAAWKAR